MLRKTTFQLLLVILTGFFLQPGVSAQTTPPKTQSTPKEATPGSQLFQLSLINPLQIFKSEYSIKGMRINLLYGLNQDLSGLDLGMVNKLNGDIKGIQLGLANFGQNNLSGVQVGLINAVKGQARAFQTGFYNSSGDAKGVQVGVLNTTQKMKGVQLGLINNTTVLQGIQIGLFYNSTDTIDWGLQIGLLNFAWNKKPVMFFPVINFRFK